jgi:site-specific DNA recombinase
VQSSELQAIVDQSADRAAYLRLAETLTTFLTRLRSSADVLDISERGFGKSHQVCKHA